MDFDRIKQLIDHSDQLDDDQLGKLMAIPEVKAYMDATCCPESHDAEHHWPFNIDRQQEREDCIYCGRTKKGIMANLVVPRRRSRARPVPRPGSFPRPDEETEW